MKAATPQPIGDAIQRQLDLYDSIIKVSAEK